MRLARATAAAMFGAAAVIYACSDDEQASRPSTGGTGSDAGGTAGSGGAGGDFGGAGGVGAGGTAGTGGEAGDAGSKVDGGFPLDGWTSASWAKPGCLLYEAEVAQARAPVESWIPCESSVAGCSYFDTSGVPGINSNPFWKLGRAQPILGNVGVSFLLAFRYSVDETVLAAYRLGTGAEAAWYGMRNKACTPLFSANLSPKHFGLVLSQSIDDDTIAVDSAYGSADSPWSVAGTTTLAPPLKSDLQLIMMSQFSDTTSVYQGAFPARLFVADYPPLSPEQIPAPSGVFEDILAHLKGEEVLFLRNGSPIADAIALRKADGSVVKLYEPASGEEAYRLQSDGQDMVWQVGTGSTVELWTAPWTNDPAAFKPRKVRDLGPGYKWSEYAGGWFAYRLDDATLRAVRVTDGNYVDAPPPKGMDWVDALGVFNGELWATFGGGAAAYSVARMPLASLGQPKP